MCSPGAARAAPSAQGTSSAASLQSRCREEAGYCHAPPCPSPVPAIVSQGSCVPPCHIVIINEMTALLPDTLQGHRTPLRLRGHPVQAGPVPSWTAHVTPLKPAPPCELMMKNKITPNSLLCSHLHVLPIQKWSCSVLTGIR